MKTILAVVLSVFALIPASFAGFPASVKGHTLAELKLLPAEVLQNNVSIRFYKSLLVSPLEGWVVVRGELSNAKIQSGRVIRSDLGGAFDKHALEVAKNLAISGDYRLDTNIKISPILVHTLIYKIADGTMTLSFVTLDRAGGNQMDYVGCAKLSVLKNDGHWVNIKGPEDVERNGLVIYSHGLENSIVALVRLDRVNFHGN